MAGLEMIVLAFAIIVGGMVLLPVIERLV